MDHFEKYKDFRAGYVTIVGRPNCGKSTLMNTLLNFKISIVTNKPQTTRQNILGILSGDGFQVVFLDTPGLLKPRYKLQETMLSAAQKGVTGADWLFVMIAADDEAREKTIKILKSLNFDISRAYLLINKIDLVSQDSLLPLIDFYQKNCSFRDIFPISALKNEGLEHLVSKTVPQLPQSPPFYPEDDLSTHPERFFVAEIIREKIILNYAQEIPYSTTVHIEEFTERKRSKDYIRAAIFVERATQRKILIGKKGEALKKIGQIAREEIEIFLRKPVYLELWVGVREKWRKNDRLLKEFGYIP